MNSYLKFFRRFFKIGDLFALLVSVFFTLRIIGGLGFIKEQITNAYFILLPCLTFLGLVTSRTKINGPYFLFLIYIILNIIICSPDAVFQPWSRFIMFAILLSVVSPLLQNEMMRKLRCLILRNICISSVIVTVISFVFYFVGINMAVFESEYEDMLSDYQGKGGWFSGLLTHSMILGPISGVASCFLFYKYLDSKNNVYLLLLIASLGALLFAASRGALFAIIASAIYLFCYYLKHRYITFKSFVKWSILILATLPFWISALVGIQSKSDRGDAAGAYGSRTGLFMQRFDEISSSPIIGIGFASVGKKSEFSENGTIEPGSSWLAIFSMTGFIGICFVIFFFWNSFWGRNRRGNSFHVLLLRPLLIFWAVHMLVEGYIFAAGSPLCFLAWLALGVSGEKNLSTKSIYDQANREKECITPY